MEIATTQEGTTTTIVVSGWLDTSTAPQLATSISEVSPSCTQLVIDLKGLEYISSAGLRQLVAAHKKMSGALTITNVSSEVLDILHMAGFDKRLNIK